MDQLFEPQVQKRRSNRAASAKYWFLDFAIILLIATTLAYAYGASLPSDSIAPICDDDLNVNNETVSATPVNAPTANQPEPSIFHAGEIVEVYEPSIHPSLAFSAQIQHVFNRADGSVKYIVRPGFGRPIDHQKFDSASVQALGSWEIEDEAVCNLGDALNKELIPCRIAERMPHGKAFGVSLMKDGVSSRMVLPISRIRRIVKDGPTR
eukprot:CAMPEP_0183736518 /NCGR_PEP_ID=MMETSP0737-20130205/49486_1 /TAXON_ID=385413 /ORGANISM="Thalassiosira miniscula, Strain CCMP1093" /LENGTH=208 /DNA_ID=CAMNT_0025970537 /DNA_START=89 /DNA_END=715 /DNA_ORIENTATION=+